VDTGARGRWSGGPGPENHHIIVFRSECERGGEGLADEEEGGDNGDGDSRQERERSFVDDILNGERSKDEPAAQPGKTFEGWSSNEADDGVAREVPAGSLEEEEYEPGAGWEAAEEPGSGSSSGSDAEVEAATPEEMPEPGDRDAGLLAPPASERRGRVNGGLVNGRRHATRPISRRDAQPGKRRIAIVVVLLLLSVGGLLAIAVAPLRGPLIDVDGRRDEWSAPLSRKDAPGDSQGAADLRGYGVAQDRDRLFAFAEVADVAFGKASAGSVYLFVDRDGKAETGYSFRGLGCEMMSVAVFLNGEARVATLYEYEDSSDSSNWSGFVSRGAGSGALRDGFAEVGFPFPRSFVSWRAALAVQVEGGARDHGDFHIGPGTPSLRVRVEQDAPVLTGADPVAARVLLDASGGDVHLTSLRLSGTPVGPVAYPITIRDSKQEKIELKLAAGAASGDTVSVEVTGAQADAVVTLLKEESRAVSYNLAAPGKVKVDGAFAEWDAMPKTVDAADPVKPPERLDLQETRATNQTQSGGPAFLVTVGGTILVGDPFPAKTSKPAPGAGGGAVVLPKVGGEDRLSLYIDVGPSPATGMRIGGIGADHRILVSGKDGRVAEATVARWSGAGWIDPRSASAEAQGSSVEVATKKSDLAWAAGQEAATFVEISGWDGARDDSGGPRLVDPIILNSNGTIYVSTGGSYSQTGVAAPAASGNTYVDLVGAGSTVYALRSDGAVHATDDLGGTWTEVVPPCSGQPACPATDFRVLATDGAGSFYIIQASGEGYRCLAQCTTSSWDFLQGGSASAGMVYVSGTGASASLYGIVPAGQSKIRSTTDGGDNWDPVGTDYPLTGNRVGLGYYVNGSTPVFYVLSAAGEIIVSSNNATTWTPLSPAPPAGSYVEMSVDPVTGRVYIVDGGGNTSYWQPGDAGWTSVAGPAGVGGAITGIIYVPEVDLAGFIGASVMAVAAAAASSVRKPRRKNQVPPHIAARSD
jgi:hypothetical protein